LAATIEHQQSRTLIRLEGVFNVMSAAGLKQVLLEGLATDKELLLDLEAAEEIDIPVMQLLWAVGCEAERKGTAVSLRLPETAELAAREAGFQRFPGLTIQG
jgi:anti-anti-sigma regulatory factor